MISLSSVKWFVQGVNDDQCQQRIGEKIVYEGFLEILQIFLCRIHDRLFYFGTVPQKKITLFWNNRVINIQISSANTSNKIKQYSF